MSVEPAVNESLKNLSRQLIPSAEELASEDAAVKQIFQLLRQQSRHKVDRMCLLKLGSSLNLNVFVNISEISGIPGVLEDFTRILTLEALPTLKTGEKSRLALLVNFKGHDMVVLPALNLVLGSSSGSSNSEGRAEQAFQILEKISSEFPSNSSDDYTSSLAETQLEFIQQQNKKPFIHELILLCNYWVKIHVTKGKGLVHINSEKFGVSASSLLLNLVELVAVYSGQLEETLQKSRATDKGLLSAFITFLRLIQEYPELKIRFDFDPLKPIRTIVRYPQFKGGHDPALRTPPYVIDPSNPLRNLAIELPAELREQLQMVAGKTLWRLMGLCTAPVYRPDVFREIFDLDHVKFNL